MSTVEFDKRKYSTDSEYMIHSKVPEFCLS